MSPTRVYSVAWLPVTTSATSTVRRFSKPALASVAPSAPTIADP